MQIENISIHGWCRHRFNELLKLMTSFTVWCDCEWHLHEMRNNYTWKISSDVCLLLIRGIYKRINHGYSNNNKLWLTKKNTQILFETNFFPRMSSDTLLGAATDVKKKKNERNLNLNGQIVAMARRCRRILLFKNDLWRTGAPLLFWFLIALELCCSHLTRRAPFASAKQLSPFAYLMNKFTARAFER